jgi:flagellar hook-associated protein 3 FlgL
MRISTSLLYDRGVKQINSQQASFSKVGQQIASGRRVVNPSDDPQAAAQAVGVKQAMSKNEQFSVARVSVRNTLSQQESILGSAGDMLSRAKILINQASNGTLSNLDRASIASEMKGIYEGLIGQANTTNGDGQYLFGGYQNETNPFVKDGAGKVVYVGDLNSRKERVDDTRLMSTGENGNTAFQTVQNSAGYLAEADPANAGEMTFVGPNVIDPNDPDYGTKFDFAFIVDGAGTRYTINGGPEIPYTDGGPIEFGGLSMTLSGPPANGDTMEVGKGAQMNTDLFKTLEKVIDVLENPALTDNDKANLENTMKTSMRELSNNFDNLLVVRASLGARLNELDSIDVVSDQRLINLEQTHSDLIDINIVDAISEYSLRQVGLQAAQRSFADIGKLSLFDFI